MSYFEVDVLAYVELVREFYTTFQFQKPANFTLKTPNLISLYLMCKRFNFSITKSNNAQGFSEFKNEHPYCDFCGDFDVVVVCAKLFDNSLDTFVTH